MHDPAFFVDVYGEYTEAQLQITWRALDRPAHSELDKMIAETWRRVEKECARTGALLFNGQMYRLLDYRADQEKFELEVGPTDFAEFLGTNFHNYHRAQEFGWEMYSNAVGISAIVGTSDGEILLGRRSDKVACMPGYVHTFGGSLEVEDYRTNGTVDGFAAITRELEEELGLKPEDFKQLICLGMIRDATICQPELIFQAEVSLSSKQLGDQLHHDEHHEHLRVVACPDNPDSLRAFMSSDEPISPIALAGLCLHGRRRFGEKWYQSVIQEFS